MLGNACEINNYTDNYTVNTANMVIQKNVVGPPFGGYGLLPLVHRVTNCVSNRGKWII